MPYSERAYFGEPCAHVAAWDEVKRHARIRADAIRAIDRRRIR
jgi:hypothetical protein